MNESLMISTERMPVDRPYLLLELLPQQPYQLLQEVFSTLSRCDRLKEFLLHWLQQFKIERSSSDEQNELQAPLDEFYFALLNLIDALHRIKEEKSMLIVQEFCRRYSQIFTRRELWCFMHAVFHDAVDKPSTFLPGPALDWYEQVLALTEAAYVLDGKVSIENRFRSEEHTSELQSPI